jgi:hypothetical protein
MRRVVSQLSTRGITRSITTRSGVDFAMESRAISPSLASSTVSPAKDSKVA